MLCGESVVRCVVIFWKGKNISGILKVKRKEYARIAIRHLCEGRVEPRHEISGEGANNGNRTVSVRAGSNDETTQKQAMRILRNTGAENRRSRDPERVVPALKIRIQNSAANCSSMLRM